MIREEKEALVMDLHEKLKKAKAAILTDFVGLNVAEMTALRRKLKNSAVEYKVVKNTLLRRASQDTEMQRILDHVIGPTAIAITYDDPLVLAKILTEFSKEQPSLRIKAGIVTGSIMTAEDIKFLATLPSKDVLIAKLIYIMRSVPTRFVYALKSPLNQIVMILESIKKEKSKS